MKFVSITHSERNIWNGPTVATAISREKRRRRWEDNISMDLQEVGCGVMDWIGLDQHRGRWRAIVNVVMNLRVP
jgi:hypothetical protein